MDFGVGWLIINNKFLLELKSVIGEVYRSFYVYKEY